MASEEVSSPLVSPLPLLLGLKGDSSKTRSNYDTPLLKTFSQAPHGPCTKSQIVNVVLSCQPILLYLAPC